MPVEEIKPGLFIQETKSGNYRMVKPIKKDLDKPFNLKTNCNYTNLILGGSWNNFFTIVFVISIIMLVSFGYAHDTKECREIISDPINFCHESNACKIISQSGVSPFEKIDLTNVNNISLPS